MENWILNDGTEVALGGSVVGDSEFSKLVRDIIANAKSGNVSSRYGASPDFEALDVNVPHLLDCFLRFEFEVVSGPSVNYPNSEPRPVLAPGSVY
jgi:hypothetical protein